MKQLMRRDACLPIYRQKKLNSQSTYRLPCCVLVLLSCVCLSSVALGDQNDARLPALFDTLQGATNPLEASQTEQEIWRIWHTSPNDQAHTMMLQARAALDSGDPEAAIKNLNTLVNTNPDFAEAWNQRAIVRYLTGDYQGSLSDVKRTVALEPNHFGAYSGMGQCLIQLEQPEAALDAFQTALDIHPWLANIRQQIDFLRAYVNARKKPI